MTGSALRFEICRGLVPLREDKTPTWGASVRVLDLVYTTDFGFWGNPGAKVPSFWSKSRLGVGTSRTLELFDKNHSGFSNVTRSSKYRILIHDFNLKFFMVSESVSLACDNHWHDYLAGAC